MSRDPTRSAPALPHVPELDWVLARAFAAPPATAAPPADPAAAFALAHRLDLAPRIATRVPTATLEGELGSPLARSFTQERHRTIAGTVRLLGALEHIARIAHTLDAQAPVVPLKGMAMVVAGYTGEGARGMADLDLLVPGGFAVRLAEALVADGFVASSRRRSEHHLPALAHPVHGAVELHDRVLGVQLGRLADSAGDAEAGAGAGPGGMTWSADRLGRRSANTASLAAHGLLTAARTTRTDLPDNVHLPRPQLLAAHALVHAIAFHGDAPRTYPTLRSLADLVDLLPHLTAPSPSRESHERTGLDPCRLDRHLSPELVTAAFELADRLRAGDPTLLTAAAGQTRRGGSTPRGTSSPAPPVASPSSSAASSASSSAPSSAPSSDRLLAHLVAGQLDAGYARRLRLRAAWYPATDAHPLWARTLALRDLVWLGDADLEAIYGAPTGRGWHWRRRVLRPFDLARRALRACGRERRRS